MPKQHDPKSLNHLLARSAGNLSAIAEKTQHLQTLNHYLAHTVGELLAQKCSVVNYKQGILTIQTVNAMMATRLNFMSAEILLNFRRDVLPDLIDISIKVQPNETNTRQADKKSTSSHGNLSKDAAEAILSVSENAPDKLKATLKRLASHAKN